jgi:hypothetical protein
MKKDTSINVVQKIASMRLELSERFTVLKTAAGTGLVQWDTTK